MYQYKYPHPAVTTDSVAFGFDGRKLHVLLIERGIEPHKGMWALPGGFMNIDETVEECAARELREEGMSSELFHNRTANLYSFDESAFDESRSRNPRNPFKP